jgi:hypothetical protein
MPPVMFNLHRGLSYEIERPFEVAKVAGSSPFEVTKVAEFFTTEERRNGVSLLFRNLRSFVPLW